MDESTNHARRRMAIALAYGAASPTVLAKGCGVVAEEIIAEAKRQGVPVHDSPELVALLMQVDLDEKIPPMLYQVVAELLVWLCGVDEAQADRGL